VSTLSRRLGVAGEAELYRWGEVVHDAAPVALVIGPTAMAFVNDDEIEEIRRIFAETGRRLAILRRAAHEGLEYGEEDAAVRRHSLPSPNLIRRNPYHRVFREAGELVVRLVGQDVAVSQEQDARLASRFVAGLPVGQVPAAFEQFPRDLERDERLARAGSQRQQNSVPTGGDGLHYTLNSDVLEVVWPEAAAKVVDRHSGKPVAPGILLGERGLPEFLWRGIARHSPSWPLCMSMP